MNRSYTKIRHIQEANQQLEKRLISEQPLLGTTGEILMDMSKDIGSHPHWESEDDMCEEKIPDRDYGWKLIQWALNSNVGSNAAGTYYGDVDSVHNDATTTSAGNVIVDTIKKLKTPNAFASFVKSYYNRPGYKNGKLDLFKELDAKDAWNPLFGWDDVVNAINPSIKSTSGVVWCKRAKSPEPLRGREGWYSQKMTS
jgi:hypothetical protein